VYWFEPVMAKNFIQRAEEPWAARNEYDGTTAMLIAGIPFFDQCCFAGSCPSRWAIGFLDQKVPQ
jgi:hypothetical protein